MLFRLPKAVVFDMDGTLIDTVPLYLDAMVGAATEHGLSVSEEAILSLVGLLGPELENQLRTTFGSDFPVAPFLASAMRRVTRRLALGAALKPGAADLVTWLVEKGIPIAIGTSMLRREALRQLSLHNMESSFSVVVGRDDVLNGKPHPDIHQEAAKRLGFEPRDVLILEDSANGVVAAHRAGAMVMMIPDTIPPSHDIRALCAGVVDDLHAVRALLEKASIKPASECRGMADIRQAIDDIDRQIIRLFGQRAAYVHAAAPFKTDDASVRALDRRTEMLETRRGWADQASLDPAFIEDLYRRVVDHFTAVEMDRVHARREATPS